MYSSTCNTAPQYFNPRLPRGRRLINASISLVITVFQSTPPSPEATAPIHTHICEMQISIHASLAGGDGKDGWQYVRHGISIHASLAGGDVLEIIDKAPAAISIHASLAGGDDGHGQVKHLSRISIHASLAGGDPSLHIQIHNMTNFNPRLPRGRRRNSGYP